MSATSTTKTEPSNTPKSPAAVRRLNERDVWLPDPATGVRVVPMADGTRRPMTPQEKDRYQRRTGEAYHKYIQENGLELLKLQPDDARKRISRETKWLRAVAANQAVRR